VTASATAIMVITSKPVNGSGPTFELRPVEDGSPGVPGSPPAAPEPVPLLIWVTLGSYWSMVGSLRCAPAIAGARSAAIIVATTTVASFPLFVVVSVNVIDFPSTIASCPKVGADRETDVSDR